MPDDPKGGQPGGGQAGQGGGTGQGGDPSAGSGGKPRVYTYTEEEHKAFIAERDGVKQRLREMEEKIAKESAAKKKADEEEAKKRGEFERLHGEAKAELEKQQAAMKALTEEAARSKKAVEALLKREIESIPEAMRSLIPEGLPDDAKLDYIAKNKALLTGGKTASVGGPSGGQGAGQASVAQAEIANIMGDAKKPAHVRIFEALGKSLTG